MERADLNLPKESAALNKEHPTYPLLAGILISFIFGFSFLFTKQSLATMSPFELLSHRFTLAAVLLLLLSLCGITKVRFTLGLFRDILPLACFQPVLYFIGETYGVQLTSATESGLIISLIPVAVTFMGVFFLREQVGLRQWLLVLTSVLGVILIVLGGSPARFGLHTLGVASLILAVLSAAAYNILSRRLSSKYSPIEITTVMMIMGAVFFNGFRLLTTNAGTSYFQPFLKQNSFIALVYLGILSSVGAFFLMNYMLKRLPAFRVATFVNLTTVVSIIAGVVFRGEHFGILHLIGGILILIGVWGINTKISLGRKV